jgi:hypothetical protein
MKVGLSIGFMAKSEIEAHTLAFRHLFFSPIADVQRGERVDFRAIDHVGDADAAPHAAR